ncbi:MAG: VanW family protein [Gallionellaceae bacterium]|jgi:vancomycin resistance protein VanW
MLSPSHPVRYFMSYNGRKLFRAVQDNLLSASFSHIQEGTPLPFLIKQDNSPIYRNFSQVRRELFDNKITNLRLALQHINGIVIEPGMTFSLWNLVGKPSAAKGYLPGLVIERGEPREGIGGGLCQLANMIHWLALHSDLTIAERHRHSFDIFPDDHRTVPFASGATIVYNYKDLRLTNNTGSIYQLRFDLDENKLSGNLHCSQAPVRKYHVEERDHGFVKVGEQLYRRNSLYQHCQDTETGEHKSSLIFHNYCLCRYSLDEVGL